MMNPEILPALLLLFTLAALGLYFAYQDDEKSKP